MRSTMRPPSGWSTAPLGSSPRGTGNCSVAPVSPDRGSQSPSLHRPDTPLGRAVPSVLRRMRDLLRRLPGDLLLYGRVFGLLTGTIWIAMGSLIVEPIGVAALTILFGTIVYSWTAQATRGKTFTLTTSPIGLVLTDLGVASLWMIATA